MKKALIGGIAGIVIGAIIGFGGISLMSNKGITKITSDTSIISKPSGAISTVDAKSIALNKVPGGTITEFNFEDGSTPSYDVNIINGSKKYEMKINANTGDIFDYKEETSKFKGTIPNNNEDIIKDNGFISPEKAKEVALSKYPNSTITGFSLDYDDITPEYDIAITNSTGKYDISINAKTGTIISAEKE